MSRFKSSFCRYFYVATRTRKHFRLALYSVIARIFQVQVQTLQYSTKETLHLRFFTPQIFEKFLMHLERNFGVRADNPHLFIVRFFYFFSALF